MRNSWILVVSFVALAIIIMVGIARSRKKTEKDKAKTGSFKPIANTEPVRQLPAYKKVVKQYRRLIGVAGVLLVLAFVGVALIASRPVRVTMARPKYENRDIMICLDMSSSMEAYIKDLSLYLSELAPKLKGQRIGLTMFNGAPVNVMPLSDDYDTLAELFKGLASDDELMRSYMNSVFLAGAPDYSEIGTGVVGCINGFDKLGEENRSRSIILLTDNEDPTPDEQITLTAAAGYAKQYDIAIYGMMTSWDETHTQEEFDEVGEDVESVSGKSHVKEFRRITFETGGAYYVFRDVTSVKKGEVVKKDSTDAIVDRIMAQAAARHEGAGTLIETDVPLIPTLLAIICFAGYFILIWRLGL